MRDIKFRAWDKNTERMHYSSDAKNYDENSGREYFPFVFEIGYKGNKDLELMQFTELSDNKGKEIYESDIINVTNCECTGYDDQGNEIYVDCIGKVLFKDGTFVFDGHSAGTIPLSAFIAEMNVIGNIHENPELLNQ
jgi:uncharacterized phage protein (TIGR01671 family)